jgi:hypothetical protein
MLLMMLLLLPSMFIEIAYTLVGGVRRGRLSLFAP